MVACRVPRLGENGSGSVSLRGDVRGDRRGRVRAGRAHADGRLHMPIKIPDFALVVLIGATGSGKSNFVAREFLATEIISSDRCRALVSDDETDQTVTSEAFELVHAIAAKRL